MTVRVRVRVVALYGLDCFARAAVELGIVGVLKQHAIPRIYRILAMGGDG